MNRTIISREDAHLRGFKRFYTGVPCKRGHTCERFTSNAGCVQCINLATPNKRTLRGRNVGWPTIGLLFNVLPPPTPEEIEAAFRMVEANGWLDHCVTEMRKDPDLLLRYLLPPDGKAQIAAHMEVERQRRILEANAARLREDPK